MPVLASVGATITTSEAAGIVASASVDLAIENDDFEIRLTLDHSAQLAAAESFQRVGLRVEIDMGAGLEVIPDNDLGIDVSITESLDEFADQLTFTLVGERYSPLARSVTRSKRPVVVSVIYGSPGNEFLARVFSGFITSAIYTVQPPTAAVTALDAAGMYATRKAKDYSVEPNSNRTRLSILHDLLSITSIPIREIDIGGDGGTISKPINPGDAEILSFIRDWLGPTGAEIGFEDGGFVARRYRPADAVTMDLGPADLCAPFTIVPPATMVATTVTVVSVKFVTVSEDGFRTEEEEVVTTAPYSRQQWVTRQTTEGSLLVNPFGQPPTTVQVVSRVVTRTTYLGNTALRVEQTEWGFYAPKAARLRINDHDGGTISPLDAYLYPDGSWRAEPQESFRRIRKQVTIKELDGDQNIVKTTVQNYFFHFLRKAIYQVSGTGLGDTADTIIAATPLLEDGGGVLFDREYMGLLIVDNGTEVEGGVAAQVLTLRPDQFTITELTLNADQAITSQVVTERHFDIGLPRSKAQVGSFAYGIENRLYTDRPYEGSLGTSDEYGGFQVVRTGYRETGEDSFQSTEQTTVNGGAPKTKVTSASGSLPRPEKVAPKSASQEINATMIDGLRVSMNGETVIALHNEYIENASEASTLATVELRKLSGMDFTFDMPIEGLLHKWKTVTMTYPLASVLGLRLHVRKITRNFSRFRQTVTAFFYPLELP